MGIFSYAGVVLLALASGALAGEAEWSAHNKAAMAAYWRGDHLGAATSFAAALNEAQGFGESDRRLASTINNLALLYSRQGRHADAEALYARAVTLDEKTLGPAHPDLAATLNNIAELYRAQARYAEAEPLYRRSLTIVEKALGPNHTQAGTTLNNLAELYRVQGRAAEAEPLYRRAFAIREKAHGANHPDVAATLGQLAELYRTQGLHAQAEPLYRRALQIEEQVFGPEHPDVATTLARQGDLFRSLNRPADAEPLYKRALAIREKTLGADHVEVARSLNGLADMYFLQGRLAEAEPAYARALRIIEQTLGPEHPEAGINLFRQALVYNAQGRRELALDTVRRASAVLALRVAQGELRPWVGVFEDHVRLLAATGERAPAPLRAAALQESFTIAQTARAAASVAQSARLTARYAGGRDALARYARARLDAIVRVKQLDIQLMQAIARPPRDRDAGAENLLREGAERARATFVRLDARPEGDPARQADLASPKPLELREAQRHLAVDEALAMLMVLPDRSFLWVVRRDGAGFFPLALRQDELAKMVSRLGGQLDARGEHRPADLSPFFDVALAHEIYRRVFAPAEALLAGAKHLILVPDGALASLPPGVLVTALPGKPLATLHDHAQVDWLIKRHAVTVLPAAAALRSRVQAARRSAAREPFRGFGELPALAGALKVSPDAMMQGAMATDSTIKGLNLARFRALAFATPGNLVQRTARAAEPALAMTAPRSPGARDDGNLTASEIAQLRLDADWVLLAGSVPPDQAAVEGRATLARSFIHAGARSVLVSYGAANPQATAEITGRVAAESAAGAPKAEALRRSMLALMTAPGDPQRAHPRYWAGLAVVGEGNADWAGGPPPAPIVAETTAPVAAKPAAGAPAADLPRAAAPQDQANPIAKALATVTGMLSQIGKSRESAPPAQAQPEPQLQPQPRSQPKVEPVAAKPAPSAAEVKPAALAVQPAPPPPPAVVRAEPPPPQPVAAPPPPPPVVVRTDPPPPPATDVRADPSPPVPVAAPAEAPVPEPAGVNPIATAIEGVGAMLKKMFGPQAEVQPQSEAEPVAVASVEGAPPAPIASASAPVSSSSLEPEAPPVSTSAPAAVVAEGDDPVSRILRDVGAALSRILTPAPGTEAAAGSAPPEAPAPPAAAALPVQTPEPAPSESGENPIAKVFSEIGVLLTRLQLALSVQKYVEREPAPELEAPQAAPVQQAEAPLEGSFLMTMDGRPVLSGSGAPVGIAKVEPAPAVQGGAAADDPIAAAFREVTEFLKRLLGGEAGTKPAP